MRKLNNNQTCIHQAVAPIGLEECIHLETIDNICPICAYEIGFLAGCSQKWSSYESFVSFQEITSKCSKGTGINKAIFDVIKENKNILNKKICIFCSFKAGFQAAYLEKNLDFELIKLKMEYLLR